jgi:predicted AlkP superfamily pyrophosphatase or phosphodiesterase
MFARFIHTAMLNKLSCILVTAFALLLALPVGAAPRSEHIFIISFDQGAPAGIAKAEMPLFKKMAAQGAHTWEAYTIVPSSTLPSHTSMLTGVGIQKHQILWNDTWTAQKPQLRVPTIFNLAKAANSKAVTAVCTSKQKFELFKARGDIDHFVLLNGGSSISIAQAFARKVAMRKPNVCLIHFGDIDGAGHAYGINSPEKMKAFANSDRALKIIYEAVDKAGIAANSTFIFTADHGCHDIVGRSGKARGVHGSAETADVTIPWVAFGKAVKPGFTITAPVVQYDTAATALWLLDIPIPDGFWGRPVTSAFKTE